MSIERVLVLAILAALAVFVILSVTRAVGG